MRLFIALNFPKEVKNKIEEIIHIAKSNASQGRFVNEEHIHLTVEFLGKVENNRVDVIKNIMDTLDYGSFTLNLTGVGYFKGREGNTYWLGIDRNVVLLNLQKELHHKLIEKGFELSNREYKPHITIGRKVGFETNFHPIALDDSVNKVKINIDKIDLMKSEFIDGKLKHTVIHSRLLL